MGGAGGPAPGPGRRLLARRGESGLPQAPGLYIEPGRIRGRNDVL